MPFQKEIRMHPAQGIPGTPHSLGPEVVEVKLAEGTVTVGRFVFPGSDPGGSLVSNSGTDTPLGLAIVTKTETMPDLLTEASMDVADGNPVTVIIRGQYFVTAATAAEVGQKAFAATADGAVTTGAAGADVAGSVETDWTVVTAAPAGEPFAISSWR